ncbi:MAG: hypothetical protein KatS3mg109_1556 [Pirellulaceae bacterium]|nr:MAG: hypothetical protein KatS3mg109_1556 [Pirellulaceae bacterium]
MKESSLLTVTTQGNRSRLDNEEHDIGLYSSGSRKADAVAAAARLPQRKNLREASTFRMRNTQVSRTCGSEAPKQPVIQP